MDETSAGSPRKNTLEELSKDELIKKVKNLLVIAQKAKQAKNDLQAEVQNYKENAEKYEKEKIGAITEVQAIRELLDSLTEQKLMYITELDAAKNKIKNLTQTCKSLEEDSIAFKKEINVSETKLAEVLGNISNLDSENISLKRQNNRLVKENEELINQLSELEEKAEQFNKIGLQQQDQLRLLEETVNKGNAENEKAVTQNNHEEENTLLDDIQKQLEEYKIGTLKLEDKLKETTQAYDTERDKTDKAYIKLRSYREKIMKCGALITQLKNSRFILLKTVKDYSESIPKWQTDIINVSKMLDGQFAEISNENKDLKAKIADLETSIAQLRFENINFKKLTAELKSNTSNARNIEIALQDLQLIVKAHESEKLMLVREKQNARDNVLELETKTQTYIEEINTLKSKLETVNLKLKEFQQSSKPLKSVQNEVEINALKEELAVIKIQHESLKKEYDNVADLNMLQKEEIETLKISLEQPKEESASDLHDSLQTDIVKLETKLSAYKQENGSLLQEMKELRNKLKEFNDISTDYEDIKAKLNGYKTENAELLVEMKEINQVLKERGETISKQMKAISEMERLIETLEKDREAVITKKNDVDMEITALKDELNKLQELQNKSYERLESLKAEHAAAVTALTEKEDKIIALQEEIERIKQNPNDMANDDMSTSTISRAEEQNRMIEFDESFEDKYAKLRLFAIKLKKRLNDANAQLEVVQQDKVRLEHILEDTGVAAKNLQKLQVEYDKQIDQIEEKTAEIKRLKKEIDIYKTKLANIEDFVQDSPRDSSGDNVLSENNELIDKLEEEVKHLSGELKKSGLEIEKLKSELSVKEMQFSTEVEQHKSIKELLEKTRKDVKTKSVLSLEMENCERSNQELKNKMDEEKKKIVQLESTIDTQQGTINSMKTQIKLLEEQVKDEETRTRRTKEELHNTIEDMKEKDALLLAKKEIIAKLEQDIEVGKRSYEELKADMTALVGDKEKMITSLAEDKTDLTSRLKRAECRCGELEEKLNITNIELEDIKVEYTSYKVRAQAVLRQNQTVDHSQEERLKEETAALSTQIDSLTIKLNATQEREGLAREAAAAAERRAGEATAEAARAQQRTARLQQDLARLAHQLEAERDQHTLQISSLDARYKAQLHELESKVKKEREELRRELEAAQARPPPEPCLLADMPDSDPDVEINVTMLPREEGEGSESSPTPGGRPGATGGGSRSPVPLDRLLEEGVPDDELDSALSLSPEQDLIETRKKLFAQIERVKHVTVLLSESERECARAAQLNEALKAEVRRARAAIERAAHAHNAEYMKNVTLKFLTLPPGDERSRLVPVLQKILTLTPEETSKLHAVAKGGDGGSARGWGLLPWSGGK